MMHPLMSVTIRLRKDPLFQTEENPIFHPSAGTDRMNKIPHRGERRKDRAVSAQCAGTALSADSSAGIYG